MPDESFFSFLRARAERGECAPKLKLGCVGMDLSLTTSLLANRESIFLASYASLASLARRNSR